ncbi:MAG: dihydrolipoamide dehydrogenase [Chloroflexi bacterium]|nr:MAG: dihydrolipoamide dehydrogenase [Chloroflexota bacterium]
MNEGCIPTKTLLASGEVLNLVRAKAHKFGVRGIDPDEIIFDLGAAIQRKDKIVQDIIDGIYRNLEQNKGIEFLTGRAKFNSPVDIQVDGKTITAEKTILAVGSRQSIPNIPGLDEGGYITNDEALQLRELPQSMIVIGAGYVGVEFAQMYSRFGTQVTLLGRAPRVMPKEEPELSELLGDILIAEGIDLHTSTEVIRAGKENGQSFVMAKSGDAEQKFVADEILVATGRIARADDLGLDESGIEMDGAYIKTDSQLQTTASNIWSLGDANGGPMFTHRATYDGPIAALNAVNGADRRVDYRVVPRAVFTEPSLASVGLTEEEAHATGAEVKIGKAFFRNSGRAKAIEQRDGVAKVIVNDETKEILGAHILGAHADILIHEVVSAMHGAGTTDRLTKSIHIHPTLSELVKDAAKAAR